MIWNLIGTIGGKVLDIVDDVVEDPERDQENAAAISGGGGLGLKDSQHPSRGF